MAEMNAHTDHVPALNAVFKDRFGIIAGKEIQIDMRDAEPAFLIESKLMHPRVSCSHF